MARKEHPRYENFEWPDWEYREYPRMVWPDNKVNPLLPTVHTKGKMIGKPKDGVIVNSDDEMAEVLGVDPPEPAKQPPARPLVPAGGGAKKLQSEEEQKAEAIDEATRLGVKVDGKWATARILDAIATHKAAAQSADDEPPV